MRNSKGRSIPLDGVNVANGRTTKDCNDIVQIGSTATEVESNHTSGYLLLGKSLKIYLDETYNY